VGNRGPFALLLVDPPYRMEAASVMVMLEELDAAGAVEPGAYLAVEHATTSEAITPRGFDIVRAYVYGDTSVTLMSRHEGVEGGA
jgi:16S rRNA (guanine966-N2)-methyltransferase